MEPTDQGLLFGDLQSALDRSQQMANTMHVDRTTTIYWYECIQLTNGQGCMVVRQDHPYDTKPGPTALSQLTPSEIAALQPYSAIAPFLPPSPGVTT